jgi:hypothetical protein
LSSQTEFENVDLFATFTNGVHKGCFWTIWVNLSKLFELVTEKGIWTLGNLGEALRSMHRKPACHALIRPTTQHEPIREELLG